MAELLSAPLSLLLDSARWFTFEAARSFLRELWPVYRDLSNRQESHAVPMVDVYGALITMFEQQPPAFLLRTRQLLEKNQRALAASRRLRMIAVVLGCFLAAHQLPRVKDELVRAAVGPERLARPYDPKFVRVGIKRDRPRRRVGLAALALLRFARAHARRLLPDQTVVEEVQLLACHPAKRVDPGDQIGALLAAVPDGASALLVGRRLDRPDPEHRLDRGLKFGCGARDRHAKDVSLARGRRGGDPDPRGCCD